MLNLLLRCRPPRFRLCSASVVASSALLWLVAASSVTAQLGLPPPELSSREQKACEAFREILALNQQALQSPEVFRSRAWRDAEDRLFAYQVSPSERQAGMFQALKEIWNCHCPIVTGRRKIHQYWQAKMEGKANPQAMATLWQHVKTEFNRTEECYREACQTPVPAPRVERNLPRQAALSRCRCARLFSTETTTARRHLVHRHPCRRPRYGRHQGFSERRNADDRYRSGQRWRGSQRARCRLGGVVQKMDFHRHTEGPCAT